MISLRTHKPEMPAHFCHNISPVGSVLDMYYVLTLLSSKWEQNSSLLLKMFSQLCPHETDAILL